MKDFKDYSIFQGIYNFSTDCGKEVQAIEEGICIEIFLMQDNSWIYDGSIPKRLIKGKVTPKKIWNAS